MIAIIIPLKDMCSDVEDGVNLTFDANNIRLYSPKFSIFKKEGYSEFH